MDGHKKKSGKLRMTVWRDLLLLLLVEEEEEDEEVPLFLQEVVEEFAPHDEDINIMLPDLGIYLSGGEGRNLMRIYRWYHAERERMERY